MRLRYRKVGECKDMDLGNRILQRRKVLGMTQAELAEKMFVTRQTVSRWEAGIVYPDVQKVSELARILKVSCDYLLMEDKEDIYLESEEGNVEQAFLVVDEQIVEKEIVKEKSSAITRLFEMLKGKNFYKEVIEEYSVKMHNYTHKDQKPYWQ